MMKIARTLLAVSVSLACAHAGAFTTAPTGSAFAGSARDIATDPLLHRAFVASPVEDSIAVVDLASRSALAPIASGPAPVALVSNSATSRLYVAHDATPGTLAVLDAVTGALLATIPVGSHPRGIATDFPHARLYVSNRGDDSVSIIDTEANTVVATLPTGHAPDGIAIDRLQGRVYVANTLDATVTVIGADAASVVATVAVGRNPGEPAVDARTGRVFVPSLDEGSVAVIAGSTPAVKTVIRAGAGATTGALSPAFRRYYVPNAADGSLTLIDLDTLKPQSLLNVAVAPVQVSIDENAGTVYVADAGDGSVTALDAEARVVLKKASTEDEGAPLVVARQDGMEGTRVEIVDGQDAVADTAIVADYYAPDAGLFFHTDDVVERRLLEDGIVGDAWMPTESYWRVWTTPAPGRVAVCRFYDFSSGSGYLFAHGAECDALRAGMQWSYDKIAYYVALPDANGACAAGTQPLFRLQQDVAGALPRTRYTTDIDLREGLRTQGWSAIGSGDASVFGCTPALPKSGGPAAAVPIHPGQPTTRILVELPFRPRYTDERNVRPGMGQRLVQF